MSLTIQSKSPDYLFDALDKFYPNRNEERRRIIVGSQGGLAYKLFIDLREPSARYLNQATFRSFKKVEKVNAYFDKVREYIGLAKKHAEDFNVTVINFSVASPRSFKGYSESNDMYCSGIAALEINDDSDISNFIEMIQSGREILDTEHEKILALASPIRDF